MNDIKDVALRYAIDLHQSKVVSADTVVETAKLFLSFLSDECQTQEDRRSWDLYK